MKSFQVVTVTILFLALLMTTDAGTEEKCRKDLKKANEQLEQLKKELEECKPALPPPECQNYQTLSNGDRKNTYMSEYTVGSKVGCDNNLGPAWFRFQGAAGTQMATSCVQKNRCGTYTPGWLNGAHPTVDEGKVTRQACFNYWDNCCVWSMEIQVRNCGDFYVYYLNKTPSSYCSLRYCGSD